MYQYCVRVGGLTRQKRVLELLEVELEMVLSYLVGAGTRRDLGHLEEQYAFLSDEPSLQPLQFPYSSLQVDFPTYRGKENFQHKVCRPSLSDKCW